jgi:hypothetical protein
MQIREGSVTSKTQLTLRREEKQARSHSMIYCTYDMLNMFRALLGPPSGAIDYMCVIAVYGGQCLVVGCRWSGAGQQGVRPGRGMLHDCSRATSLFLYAHPAVLHLTHDNQQPNTAHHRRK